METIIITGRTASSEELLAYPGQDGWGLDRFENSGGSSGGGNGGSRVNGTRGAMIEILSREQSPQDQEILSEMNQRFPDKKFGGAILSWYKNRFQKGQLKGMDGESHQINQV